MKFVTAYGDNNHIEKFFGSLDFWKQNEDGSRTTEAMVKAAQKGQIIWLNSNHVLQYFNYIQ